MDIIEIKCSNCSKEIYIQQDHAREKMFCTLGCLEFYNSPSLLKAEH